MGFLTFDGFIYLPGGGRFEEGNESSVSGDDRLTPLSLAIFSMLSFRESLS